MKTKFTISLLTLLIVSIHFSNAQSPPWAWEKGVGIAGDCEGKGIATDAYGNSYVVGQYSGTVNFGSGITLTTLYSFASEPFVAKYNPNGVIVWAKAIALGNTGSYSAYKVDLDPLGNCYVVGRFFGTADFGNSVTLSSAGGRGFIAKYDANGTALWAKNAADKCYAISVDKNGNSCVNGHFTTAATMGTITLSDPSTQSLKYVARFDNNGVCQWACKVTGTDGLDENFQSIGTDGDGNCYFTGYMPAEHTVIDTAHIDVSIGAGGFMYMAKFNPAGHVQWAKFADYSGSQYPQSLCVNDSGYVYLAGTLLGVNGIYFGVTVSWNNLGNLAKFSKDGNFIWVNEISSSGVDPNNSKVRGLRADSAGNCYMTGSYSGTATFNTDVIALSNTGIFAAKFDNDGNALWGNGVCSYLNGYTYGYAIGFDKYGNGFVAGTYSYNLVFGTDTLFVGNFSSNILVAKLGSAGVGISEFSNSSNVCFTNTGSGIVEMKGFVHPDDIFNLEVYNLRGQKVFSQKMQKPTVDLSFLNSGIYIIRCCNSKDQIVQKISIVH